MSKHIIDDAKRCLQCKKPLCTTGCPINTPIRDVIALLMDNNLKEAGRILFENNPLSLVCSHICHQENQCEGHCILGKNGGMPVFISAIEKYISDFYLNIYRPVASTGKSGKVAIIGSGPAGITIAFMLAKKNYDVTIFEGHDRIGGVLRYGIPEFRLPKSILDRLVDALYQKGIKIRPNISIGTNLGIDDLFRDGFKAVFMGTGVWQPNRLNIKGESLGHVHYAIEYLKNPAVYRLGKTLTIIGAGNVAIDVARTAVRHGCRHVTVVCHTDESGLTARQSEIEYAKIDGVKFEMMRTPVEITDDGVVFADSEVYTDGDGNKQVRPVSKTETLEPSDSVIIAISQGPRSVIVSSTAGIDVNSSGLVSVDLFGHTTREGVFAGGDVVTGAKTVVEAVQISKRVAESIDNYIKNLD